MRWIYVGTCAAGEVVFRRRDESVVMRQNEPVEVPDWLAAKIAGNSHFVQAPQAERPKPDLRLADDEFTAPQPPRKGRRQ